jgi:hypothetical protein
MIVPSAKVGQCRVNSLRDLVLTDGVAFSCTSSTQFVALTPRGAIAPSRLARARFWAGAAGGGGTALCLGAACPAAARSRAPDAQGLGNVAQEVAGPPPPDSRFAT